MFSTNFFGSCLPIYMVSKWSQGNVSKLVWRSGWNHTAFHYIHSLLLMHHLAICLLLLQQASMLVLLVTILLLDQIRCFHGVELFDLTMVGLGPRYPMLFDLELTIPLSLNVFCKPDWTSSCFDPPNPIHQNMGGMCLCISLFFLKMDQNHKNFVSLYVSTTYCFVCHVNKWNSKKFANFYHLKSSFFVKYQSYRNKYQIIVDWNTLIYAYLYFSCILPYLWSNMLSYAIVV